MMGNLLRYLSTTVIVLWLALIVTAFRDDDVGETIPQRVEMNVGDNVNISCQVNPKRFVNSCQLNFTNAISKEPVNGDDIIQINSTYIVYMLRNVSAQSTIYQCKCGEDAIMQSEVFVGTAPREVSKFQCRSYDFEYMNCNFTIPKNAVYVQYNLTYCLERADYEVPAICNFEPGLAVCNIAEHSYRPQAEYYHFKLHSSNSLGNLIQKITINNLNVMVPAVPGDEFRITKLTTNSMEATWSMPKYDSYKHRGLQWEVLLQPVDFPVRNVTAQVRVVRIDRVCKLILNELPFAHYSYELRLRVKVRAAAASEVMWSPTFKYQFRTQPRIPDRPPGTANGGFFLKPYENEVRLYWEELEKWEENGENFTYLIRASKKQANGKTRALQPLQQEASFAVFEWQNDLLYTFDISSRNHIGESSTSSRITVHPQTSRSAMEYTPHSIHNAYHQTNRSYTLTWLPSPVHEGLQSYTVYWCYSKLANSNDCRGSIHFKHVSRESHSFSTEPQLAEHEHSLTLAVSANYLDYNTGMHWTSCSLDVNADFEPMLLDGQSISATALKLEWGAQNVCPSILSGYNLTYCEVANSTAVNNILPHSIDGGMYESFTSAKTVLGEKLACKGSPITVTIDKNLKECNITGLKPFTGYRVEMFMFSNIKVGKPNEQLLVRTFESAPTPPRQLRVTDLSDTSAKISWLPPSQTNGYIRQYIVKLNSKEFLVNASAFDNVNEISFVLQNLTSFTSYKAFVIAITKYNSDHSNDIHFTTHMSAPSKLVDSYVVRKGEGKAEIQWSPPSVPGGRLDYYEVNVKQLRGDNVQRWRISVIFGTRCLLRVPNCPDHDYQTTVEVRAINVGVIGSNDVNPKDIETYSSKAKFDQNALNYEENDDLACIGEVSDDKRQKALLERYHNKDKYLLYTSEWYPITRFMCGQQQLIQIATYTFMVLGTSILIITLMFFGSKKLKKMRDIECILPQALDVYLTKECNGNANGYGGTTFNGDVGDDFANGFVTSTAVRTGDTPTPYSSNERLLNEERHLLGVHKNDSGYIGDGTLFGRSISAVAASVAAANEGSEENLVYRGREYLTSESSADSLIGSTNSNGGGSGDGEVINALPLKRITEEPSRYVQAAAANGAYVTAADFNKWTQPKVLAGSERKSAENPNVTGTAALSGCITQNELPAWAHPKQPAATETAIGPACHSGYIKPTDLKTANAWPQQLKNPANSRDAGAGIQGDYIKPSDLCATSVAWPEQQQRPFPAAPNNSGCISVDSLMAPTSSASANQTPTGTAGNPFGNCYVQPSVLQQLLFSPPPTTGAKSVNPPLANTNFSEYTTLDALGILTPPQGVRNMNSPPEQTVAGRPGLIGYVTQREMNEFGQQQQQQ